MISAFFWQNTVSSFQHHKAFNITVIQVYAPTTEEDKVEWFYDDLQDLLELTTQKMSFSS